MSRRSSRPIDAPHAEDAFGEMVWDAFHDDLAERPVYRRDDGDVTAAHLDAYFTAPETWSEGFRDALAWLDGPVLDAGCGPGKHARYLGTDHEVLAVDRSPGAVAVARESGVDHAAVMDLRDVAVLDSCFEGVLAVGKQLAVGDSLADLRATLGTLAEVVPPGGRLVADFDRPERRDPEYIEDHRLGDGAAYRRFRVEYDGLTGPWVDVLLLAPGRLRTVVTDLPWRIVAVEDGDGSDYLVRFERSAVPHGVRNRDAGSEAANR